MHRGIERLFAIAIAGLALSGCGNLFTTNYFENFDGPPSADELTQKYTDSSGDVPAGDADDFVEALQAETSGGRFFDDLSAGDRAELSAALQSVYTNPDPAISDETRQAAALLAAEVIIRDTKAQDTINNVTGVLTDQDSGGSIDLDNASSLVGSIIPDSAQNDPNAIDSIITDLVSAAGAFDGLSQALTDNDSDGEADPAEGVTLATAQEAAVSIAVRDLVNANGGGAAGTAAVRDAIINDTLDSLTAPPSPIGDEPASPTPLDLILQSAGLSADLFAGDS